MCSSVVHNLEYRSPHRVWNEFDAMRCWVVDVACTMIDGAVVE